MSQENRTVFIEKRTTSSDRKTLVSTVPRTIFNSGNPSTLNRVVYIPQENRTIRIDRQTTSADRTVKVA